MCLYFHNYNILLNCVLYLNIISVRYNIYVMIHKYDILFYILCENNNVAQYSRYKTFISINKKYPFNFCLNTFWKPSVF